MSPPSHGRLAAATRTPPATAPATSRAHGLQRHRDAQPRDITRASRTSALHQRHHAPRVHLLYPAGAREYLPRAGDPGDMLFSSTLPRRIRQGEARRHREMRKTTTAGLPGRDPSRRAHPGRHRPTPIRHGTVETIQNLEREQVLAITRRAISPPTASSSRGDFDSEGSGAGEAHYGAPARDLSRRDSLQTRASAAAPQAVALSWPDAPDYELYRAEEGEPSLDLFWSRRPSARAAAGLQVLSRLLSDEHRSPCAREAAH